MNQNEYGYIKLRQSNQEGVQVLSDLVSQLQQDLKTANNDKLKFQQELHLEKMTAKREIEHIEEVWRSKLQSKEFQL
jgi:hypothetical protein